MDVDIVVHILRVMMGFGVRSQCFADDISWPDSQSELVSGLPFAMSLSSSDRWGCKVYVYNFYVGELVNEYGLISVFYVVSSVLSCVTDVQYLSGGWQSGRNANSGPQHRERCRRYHRWGRSVVKETSWSSDFWHSVKSIDCDCKSQRDLVMFSCSMSLTYVHQSLETDHVNRTDHPRRSQKKRHQSDSSRSCLEVCE